MVTLKAARTQKRLTQNEAAELIGISVSTLYNYEARLFYPTVPIIKSIERVYGVKFAEIEWGI